MGEGVKGLFLALPTVHFFFGTLCSASLIQLCEPSYLSFFSLLPPLKSFCVSFCLLDVQLLDQRGAVTPR